MDRAVDPIVEANRQMLLERSQRGIAKYGVTLEQADLPTRDYLVHALEEVLDLANYLQAAIRKMEK